VVCVKITFDITLIDVDEQSRAPLLKDVPFKISDFDLNAVEEAVRLKERHGGKVTSVSVGPVERKDPIKRALAMGVDEAYFITVNETLNPDSSQLAQILHAFLRTLGSYDVIICGEGSVDEYNSQIGPRLSELLAIPLIAHASKIEISDRTVSAQRSLEEVKQSLRSTLPVVLTVGSEINEPRFPTLLQIMSASKKPTSVISTEELGVRLEEPTFSILEVLSPDSRRRRIKIEGDPKAAARKLVANLVQEGVLS